MELVFSFIAAMLAGIIVALIGIERDLREIIDNMYDFEENNDYKED